MHLTLSPLPLTKRHALTISRGTSGSTVNVIVRVEHEGFSGLGEMAPSGVTGDTLQTAEVDLPRIVALLTEIAPWELDRIEAALRRHNSAAVGLGGVGGGSALRAAVEIACHDWLGKRANLPLWKLFGLDRTKISATSVTVGINPPETAAEQAREWQSRTGAKVLKIKLGSPAGIDADRELFEAVRAAALPGTVLRVDANGGWTAPSARPMIRWLAERGAQYVEQPLAQGDEENLASLRPSPVPIFADESIRVAADVPKLAGLVDGVNVKLMKCGGIREACRIVAVARAHGLQTMLGCMGESSLAISAGAQISPLFDHLDLDSHLNLLDDPFALCLDWQDGKVIPGDGPGLGVSLDTEHLPGAFVPHCRPSSAAEEGGEGNEPRDAERGMPGDGEPRKKD